MKLRKLLRNTNTLLNSSWKSLRRLKKSNISKFKRRSLKRREDEKIIAAVPESFKLEREFFTAEEQTVSLSQISLEAVIELAAREVEESAEVCYKTHQEEWQADLVYEEMNFNGRNDDDNDEEYMEMNFIRL